jgi:hypothetical protein
MGWASPGPCGACATEEDYARRDAMTPTDPTPDIATLHEDDSYGDCVICREWVPHTDDEYKGVAFPCPTVRLARAEAAVAVNEEVIHTVLHDMVCSQVVGNDCVTQARMVANGIRAARPAR